MPIIKYLKSLNLISYILLSLLLVQLAFSVWSVNRGFDFSDEAFGYLGFMHPEEVSGAVTYYTTLYNTFFGWMDLSIIKVRILRLALMLLCGSVFSFGISSWIKRKGLIDSVNGINLALFVLIGCFLVNANGSQSFTYNLFSTLLLQLIVGGFLYSFQKEGEIDRWDTALHFMLGSLLFALFSVKFSNAILLSIALFPLLIYDKKKIKKVTHCSAAIVTGAFAMGLLMFKGSFFSWTTEYYNALTTLSGNSNGTILDRYVEDFKNVKTSLFINNWFIVVSSVLLLILTRLIQKKVMNTVIAMLFAGLMIFVTYENSYFLGGYKYTYTATFFYLFLIAIMLCAHGVQLFVDAIQKKGIDLNHLLITILLGLVPFVGAIGTNNLLSVQFVWYTPFFFALLYLLLYLHRGVLFQLLVIIIGVNGTIQSTGLVYYPYRINETLYQESYRLSTAVSQERVMVNEAIKASIENSYSIIHSQTNYEEGGPIFSFRFEYGLIYFLKGTLPGWSWYKDEASAANCELLKKSKMNNLDQTIFILPKNYEPDSVFRTCLKNYKIDFPANYAELGEVQYSIEGIDRPLKIYAPKILLKSRNK